MKKSRNGFISGFITALLLVSLVGGALAVSSYQKQATLNYSGIIITLDDKTITPTDAAGNAVEPFGIDGTTYLPVRGIANALGLGVTWDGTTQTVKLTSAGSTTATPPSQGEGATTGQKNALEKANNYLSMMAFSRTGLIKQLEYENFSNADATYAVDNCGADWNAQAAKKAKSYLDAMAFSRDNLIKQLEFEGFTNEQAVYGVEQNGY